MATDAMARAEAKFGWLPFLGIGTTVGGKANASAERLGSSIINKAISNSINLQ